MSKCTLCGGNASNGVCSECGMPVRRDRVLNYHQVDNENSKQEKSTQPNRQQPNRQQPNMRMVYQSGSVGKKSIKKIVRIIATLIIIFGIGSKLYEGIREAVHPATEYDLGYDDESTAVYDPYAYVSSSPVGAGVKAEFTLESGDYIVGVHIPQGIYEASPINEYDYIQVYDQENYIYLYEYAAKEDNYLDYLWLFDGATIFIGGENPITIATDDASDNDLVGIKNPLSESDSVTFDGVLEVGLDCELGVYDLSIVSDDGGLIELYYETVSEDTLLMSLDFYEFNGSHRDGYKNLILPEGTILSAQEGLEVSLVPSEVIKSMNYLEDSNIGIKELLVE
ncbi:MAG: hypothetical protein ACK5LL_07830 [Suipraeoptans sp.]